MTLLGGPAVGASYYNNFIARLNDRFRDQRKTYLSSMCAYKLRSLFTAIYDKLNQSRQKTFYTTFNG